MKYKEITASALLLLIGLGGVRAQEAVTVTGGDASGSGGSASYTVGQVVYATNTGTDGSVAQGVQQPYEVSTTTGIEVAEINLEFIGGFYGAWYWSSSEFSSTNAWMQHMGAGTQASNYGKTFGEFVRAIRAF